jgi:type I restriction enzyme S subunit
MGKLVPQDPNDGDANTLDDEVIEEREKLISEGKLKKQKPLPTVNEEEMSYELPSQWKWTRLPDISFFQEGPGILAKDFRNTGVPLIRIAGMKNDFLSLDGCNYLDEKMVEKKWAHFKLDMDDIVLSSSASLGKVSKVSSDTVGCIVYTGLIRFKTYRCLCDAFLVRFLSSTEFERQINQSKTGAAIQHFGPSHLRNMVVPLPPLAEQHRIVEKVDELMALCDQLKDRLNQAQTLQQQLADAVVEQSLP